MSQSISVLLSNHLKMTQTVASPGSGGSELDHFPLLSFPSESSPLSAAHTWGRLTPLPADGMPSCEVILQRGTEPREAESLCCDCYYTHPLQRVNLRSWIGWIG